MKDSILRIIKEKKEILLYLIFGVLSMILSIGTFSFLSIVCGISPMISNVLSWIITIIFVYLTNRKWVFESKRADMAATIREFISFVAGRIFTLLLEEVILWIGISLLHGNAVVVKTAAQVVVVVSNYIISKWFIFQK